jgi:hypothetical protein
MVMVMMLATALAVQEFSSGQGPLPDVPRVRSDDLARARRIVQPAEQSVTIVAAGVRSTSAKLGPLIDDGIGRSKTFANLVTAIEATDGIVYVEEGGCPPGVAACLEWRVTLAGAYRILFVRIPSGRAAIEVIASIGHELQHALEVLQNRSLRRNSDIVLFYHTPGTIRGVPRAAETRAATTAGNAVLRELRRSHERERDVQRQQSVRNGRGDESGR